MNARAAIKSGPKVSSHRLPLTFSHILCAINVTIYGVVVIAVAHSSFYEFLLAYMPIECIVHSIRSIFNDWKSNPKQCEQYFIGWALKLLRAWWRIPSATKSNHITFKTAHFAPFNGWQITMAIVAACIPTNK